MSQNFKNGKIYKITNNINNDIYVGSSCDILRKRFNSHKCRMKKEPKNIPLYKLMNELGIDAFRIDLIEDYPCDDKQALRQREGYWIRQIATLNKVIPGRAGKEYRDEHKEMIKEREKKYYEENKEKYLNKVKEYRDEHKEIIKEKKKLYYDEKVLCDCGILICRGNLTKHKKSKKHLEFLENSK